MIYVFTYCLYMRIDHFITPPSTVLWIISKKEENQCARLVTTVRLDKLDTCYTQKAVCKIFTKALHRMKLFANCSVHEKTVYQCDSGCIETPLSHRNIHHVRNSRRFHAAQQPIAFNVCRCMFPFDRQQLHVCCAMQSPAFNLSNIYVSLVANLNCSILFASWCIWPLLTCIITEFASKMHQNSVQS
jgi:hypothetical protein